MSSALALPPSSSTAAAAAGAATPQALYEQQSPQFCIDTTITPLHQQDNFFLPPTPPPLPNTSSSHHRHRPTHSRHHRHTDRRRDCFELLQVIIQENERREREEFEQMVRDAPEVTVARHSSTSQDLPSILINKSIPTPALSNEATTTTTTEAQAQAAAEVNTPPPSPKRPSVRFAADPPLSASKEAAPQPQPTTSRTSSMTNKLRSLLHLSSKKVSNL